MSASAPAASRSPVFLARPRGRNEALGARLSAAGLTVHLAPALQIALRPGVRPVPAAGDLCFFVSGQAVAAYFSSVTTPWPAGAWAGAVGPSTAHALRTHVPAGQIIAPPPGAFPDSAAFFAALQARALTPRRAFLLRAQDGREWLAQRLAEAGWAVSAHALYARTPLRWSAAVCAHFARAPRAPVLLATSAATLDAVVESLAHWNQPWPAQLHIVTFHARSAQRLQCDQAIRAACAIHVHCCEPDDDRLFQVIRAAATPPLEATHTP